MHKGDWNTTASMWLCPAWQGEKSPGEESKQDAANSVVSSWALGCLDPMLPPQFGDLGCVCLRLFNPKIGIVMVTTPYSL